MNYYIEFNHTMQRILRAAISCGFYCPDVSQLGAIKTCELRIVIHMQTSLWHQGGSQMGCQKLQLMAAGSIYLTLLSEYR